MKAWTRWQDWANLALGTWLFCAPWLFGTIDDDGSSWNAWIIGALIMTLALWALWRPETTSAEWTNVVLGVWLIAAPFMFGYTDVDEAAWNAGIVGVCVAALAGWALVEARKGAGTVRQ